MGAPRTAAGALYGDLYVIERDGAGVPITRNVTYTDAETNQPVTVACVQPLAESCALLPLWGECNATNSYPPGVLVPVVACSFNPELNDPCAVYANPDGVTDQFTELIQEVKFGRESVSRAPATVMDKSYAEALNLHQLARPPMCDGYAIKLDPSGRLSLCLASETVPVTWVWKTIDAPLENLGLYRAVMTNGCFGNGHRGEGRRGGRARRGYDRSGPDRDLLPQRLRISATWSAATRLLHRVPDTLQARLTRRSRARWTPDPVGGAADTPCGWELAITPDRTASTYKPGDEVTGADMLSAAAYLAAGADKTSPITLDEVVNLNNYLGVNLWTYSTVRKVKTLTIKYFTFKDAAEDEWLVHLRPGNGRVQAGIVDPSSDSGLRLSPRLAWRTRSTCSHERLPARVST